MERNETVKEHCKHKDCIYRVYIDGGNIPICYYAVLERKSRGCKISECDKYKAGVKTQPRMKPEYWIEWEREIYGTSEDADSTW